MENLPDFPPNLAKLSFYHSHLQQDAIETLEKLPNLRILQLQGKSYHCEEMICSSGGFPRLEFLEFDCLGLNKWIVEEGALASLKEVQLVNFDEMETLPKQVRVLMK